MQGQLRYMLLHRSTGKVSLGSVARALSWRLQPQPCSSDSRVRGRAAGRPATPVGAQAAASKVSRKSPRAPASGHAGTAACS